SFTSCRWRLSGLAQPPTAVPPVPHGTTGGLCATGESLHEPALPHGWAVANVPPRSEDRLVRTGGDFMHAKPRLGRGLDALLSDSASPSDAPIATAQIAIDRIQQNPFQPRKAFDDDDLEQLSASIREHGVLQPVVVRPSNDGYQLIAGERRLRAAQRAGLSEIPVRVVDFNDQQVLEAALAENIQRSDLNPIEKAHGFKEYLDRFGVNYDQLAQRLGLARSTITNLVNLLELAPDVQEGVRLNQISEAHAKLLKGVK